MIKLFRKTQEQKWVKHIGAVKPNRDYSRKCQACTIHGELFTPHKKYSENCEYYHLNNFVDHINTSRRSYPYEKDLRDSILNISQILERLADADYKEFKTYKKHWLSTLEHWLVAHSRIGQHHEAAKLYDKLGDPIPSTITDNLDVLYDSTRTFEASIRPLEADLTDIWNHVQLTHKLDQIGLDELSDGEIAVRLKEMTKELTTCVDSLNKALHEVASI